MGARKDAIRNWKPHPWGVLQMSYNKCNSNKLKNLSKYKLLSKFLFTKEFREDGACVSSVRIVICDSASPGSNYLELIAVNAIEVNVGNLNRSTCVFLRIDDISRNMIEGGNFKISDIESNQFRIICERVDFHEG
jgi:hypothetical protein